MPQAEADEGSGPSGNGPAAPRPTIPARVHVLRVLVLLAAVTILVLAFFVFFIVAIWWRDGLYDRVSFGTWEGLPFLVAGGILACADYHLFVPRRAGWWLALTGSAFALGQGLYRSLISLAYIPNSGASTPWVSSVPFAYVTLSLGILVLGTLVLSYGELRGIAWSPVPASR